MSVPQNVSWIVNHNANMTDLAVKYSEKVAQFHPGFVASPWTNCATTTNVAMLVTQRHGCQLRATVSSLAGIRVPSSATMPSVPTSGSVPCGDIALVDTAVNADFFRRSVPVSAPPKIPWPHGRLEENL